MSPIAFITGATSGIGEATARLLAQHGYNLIICGRRFERLERLKNELEKRHGVKIAELSFDIRDRYQCEAAVESLPEEFRQIDILVNSAGLAAGVDPVQDGDWGDWERMIDTNIKGVLYMTRKICTGMIERGRGHVINIGSIAGRQTYRGGAVYSATKFAVKALTKGMRIDMLPHKIKVTEIAPGMAETEFSLVRYDGDEKSAGRVYKGVEPLTGEDVAAAVLWALSQPKHVNIDVIELTSINQASAEYVFRDDK